MTVILILIITGLIELAVILAQRNRIRSLRESKEAVRKETTAILKEDYETVGKEGKDERKEIDETLRVSDRASIVSATKDFLSRGEH